MLDSFPANLAFLLKQEGGFAQLPFDETTNLGVKKSTWEEYIGRKVTVDDMKKLTVAMVTPLYLDKYYKPSTADRLFNPLDLCVFDLAVHSGVGRSLQALSKLTGVSLNLKMRDAMIENLNNTNNQLELCERLIDWRQNFLRGLKHYKVFARGWERRLQELRQTVRNRLNSTT